MNIELIIKLARLANNNPNENEANLAARKVCRLMAEGQFKFVIEQPKTAQAKVNVASNPSPPAADWVKKHYTEPDRRSEPFYTEQEVPYSDIFDFLGDMARRQRESPFKDNKPFTVDWDEETPKPKSKREKRPVQCTRCRKDVMTAFVGPPQIYVCTDCIWEEHKPK